MSTFGDASNTKAGQARQYAVNPSLSEGLNSDWLEQITDTEADGHAVSGRREKVWAIGPGMVLILQ